MHHTNMSERSAHRNAEGGQIRVKRGEGKEENRDRCADAELTAVNAAQSSPGAQEKEGFKLQVHLLWARALLPQ